MEQHEGGNVSSSEIAAGRADGRRTVSATGYRALAQFRFLIRQFLALSEEMARAKGLTPQQHQLLLAIEGRPADQDPTISYVAERLMIKHHSAVGLVDRLEAQGLIEREQCTADRRQVLVRLTDQGVSVLRDLAASHRQELRSLAPHLVDALSAIVDAKSPKAKSSKPSKKLSN